MTETFPSENLTSGSFPLGTLIDGRYRLDAPLSVSALLEDYQAVDTQLNQSVSIKILKKDVSQDETQRAIFKREAREAARLIHPGIIRVIDSGTFTDGNAEYPFLVNETFQGNKLSDLISSKTLSPKASAVLAMKILTALEHAHRAGVLHHDLKPDNILISKSGETKISDFGIARAVTNTAANLTQVTAVLGTANYFSPEQARGEEADARSDLYSIGIVLYEMLTGVPPFSDKNPVNVAFKHMSEKPRIPSSINPDVPKLLDTVVGHAISKSRNVRYQNTSEFTADLNRAISGIAPHGPKVSETTQILEASTDSLSVNELALRLLVLGEDNTNNRTERRPTAAWVWAVLLVLVATLVSIIFWVSNLQNNNPPDQLLPPGVVIVPDFTGQNVESARTQLQDLGINSRVFNQPSLNVAEGDVISSEPPANERVTSATDIKLYVSTGARDSLVPNVIGVDKSEAIRSLRALSFIPVPVDDDTSTEPAGKITAIEPGVGTSIKEGSLITIHVSTGKGSG